MNLHRARWTALMGFGLVASLGILAGSAFGAQTHKTRVSATQAESTALRKYRSGKIHGKTELENEDGKWQYAVMVKTGGKLHEVMVDANSGKIASEETVTAKEEATEKRAEAAHKHHGKTKGAPAHPGGTSTEAKESGEKGEKD